MTTFTTTVASGGGSGGSTLGITRTDLKLAVARFMGITRTEADWTDEDEDTINDIIENGEREFYQPPILPGEKASHTWSFLSPTYRQTISAPYETGTVAIASGVVTLTTGTWPTWAADGWLTVSDYGYTVATRTSGTVIVLDDTSVTVSSGASYSIGRWQYTLPTDFGGLIDNALFFSPDDNLYSPIQVTTTAEILSRRQTTDWGTPDDQPLLAAIAPKSSERTAVQGSELWLWPTPVSAGVIEFKYYSIPHAITDDAPYPMGGQPHSATLRAAVLAAAELETDGIQGPHYAKFMERLATSVSHDRRMGPKHLGNMNTSAYSDSYYRHGRDYITYNGTLYSGD